MGAMTVRTEGSFDGHDGTELFYQTWTIPEARATLVVTHGMSEHSEAYDLFASGMTRRGWNIIGWDLRGHGRSQGKRGYVDEFKTFSEDLAAFIQFLERQGKLSLPYALVGHSMGGLISLRYLIDHGHGRALACSLSSPLLKIAIAVPPLKDFAARILVRFAPKATLYNEIAYDQLSRDPEVLASYPKDPLRHDKIAPTLFFSMQESMAYVQAHSGSIKLPILMQLSGHDLVVDQKEAAKFFPTIGSKEKKLLVYDDSYHEIFNDLDRERVYQDLDLFLKRVMGLS